MIVPGVSTADFSLRSPERPGARIDHDLPTSSHIPGGCGHEQYSRLTVVEPAGPGSRAACPNFRVAHLVPGRMRVPRRWAQVPDNRYPLMINGVAVVSAPAEIDVANAEQLRTVLLEAGRRGHARVVVDMTRTRFCDSAGFSALAEAHMRAMAAGCGWSSRPAAVFCGSSP